MFGLFCKKKVHLSRADFIILMLSLQQRIVSFLLKSAQQWCEESPKLSFQLNPDECEIFSLSILFLTIPDRGLNNVIYNEYCRHMNFDNDTIKQFYEHLNTRYEEYREAFNDYLENPTSGVLGGVVANGLKGGEVNSIETSIVKTFAAFNIFAESFQWAVEFIGDLKKKYDLSEVSSVFVAK